jgi:hypothetical protein
MVVLDVGEKPPSAGANVQQAHFGGAPAAQSLAERHQRLPAHSVGCTVEHNIDLVIV